MASKESSINRLLNQFYPAVTSLSQCSYQTGFVLDLSQFSNRI